jgi:hypothetical protein
MKENIATVLISLTSRLQFGGRNVMALCTSRMQTLLCSVPAYRALLISCIYQRCSKFKQSYLNTAGTHRRLCSRREEILDAGIDPSFSEEMLFRGTVTVPELRWENRWSRRRLLGPHHALSLFTLLRPHVHAALQSPMILVIYHICSTER